MPAQLDTDECIQNDHVAHNNAKDWKEGGSELAH